MTKGRLPDGTLFPMPITLDINEKLVRTRALRRGTLQRQLVWSCMEAAAAAADTNPSLPVLYLSDLRCLFPDQYATLSSSSNPRLTLKDEEGNPLAIMEIREMYRPDKVREGKEVFGGDADHPAVAYLRDRTGDVYVSGRLLGLQAPVHYDHADIRRTCVQCA